jgi:transcriptional regulator with XRE-family HTH domain
MHIAGTPWLIFFEFGNAMTGNYIRAALSGNLKKLRKYREWSQTELAKKANISMNFLSEIERGRKWPYPETLQNLAEALGVEVFEFFRPNENETTPCIKDYLNRLSTDITVTVKKSVKDTIFNIMRQYGD